ncbi:hypothetical protein H8356DRAFT_1428406 [Neocallimastix lanati (nom. inval.)]|nr:hypothetical protein H8356DRAFT_1428406 [Neocallimastix sp. JGI-2020a]
MEGYQYIDPDTNVADLNRVNKNGIGQDNVNNKGVDVLDHLINVMSDDQKNTNLPQQSANLYSYLTINNNNDGGKKLHDFTDPNRWANEILNITYNYIKIRYDNENNANIKVITMNLKNYVVNAISNNVTNDLNKIMQSVNKAISQSYNVLRKI